MTRPGIDISHHQGKIDWPAVARSGITFAFIKASESTHFRDSRMVENVTNARRAGLDVGVYHFAQPNRNNPTSEVAHFVRTITPVKDLCTLPPILDLEVGSGQLGRWAFEFLAELERKGFPTPGIYLAPGWWEGHDNDAPAEIGRFPLWVAHWGVSSPRIPRQWQKWHWWQTSSSGRVPGISGNVDMNKGVDQVAPPSDTNDAKIDWIYQSTRVVEPGQEPQTLDRYLRDRFDAIQVQLDGIERKVDELLGRQ